MNSPATPLINDIWSINQWDVLNFIFIYSSFREVCESQQFRNWMRTWNLMRLNKLKCGQSEAVDIELRANIQPNLLFFPLSHLSIGFTLIFQSVDIAHFFDRLSFFLVAKWNISLNTTKWKYNIKRNRWISRPTVFWNSTTNSKSI